jgi:hypothetical protein
VEVVSPVVELAPKGGRYTFVEDWWAARVKGPVLAVNQVGAVARMLRADQGRFTGQYGVFHAGRARLVLLGEGGQVVQQGREHPVTPLESLVLDEEITVAQEAVRAEVRVQDGQGREVGVLDSAVLKR